MSESTELREPTPAPTGQTPVERAEKRASDLPLARFLSATGRTLITAGVVVLLFVIFQLWGTNVQEARAQSDLRDDFDTFVLRGRDRVNAVTNTVPIEVDAGEITELPEDLPPPSTTSTLPGGIDPEILALFFPEDGEAVARIEIPSIGVDKIVVNGVTVTDLRKGPGYYPSTSVVGSGGNTAIAGHRTTYGAPFGEIDELEPGDEIHITGILGRFTYRVMAPEVAFTDELHTVEGQGGGHILVRPSDTWVLGDFSDNRITLTACNPKYSARQRIIVAAELVDDTVEVPEWADNAVAGALSALGDDEVDLGADEFPLGDEGHEPAAGPEPAGPEPADPEPADPETPAPRSALDNSATFDTGLNGDRDAIPGAIAWMIGAITFWIGGAMIGRRIFDDLWPRFGARIAGMLPALVCLWLSFEMIDRALPAG